MLIQCLDIHKSFGKKDVLQGVDLGVEKNEILTLLGASGCGKSTLLRIIAGLENPNKGEVLINNKTVFSNNKNTPPQKRGLSFVFQDYALFPHMSVEKNILFGMQDIPTSQHKSKIGDIASLLDIKDLLARYPHELSGGEQQRVALARSIAKKPDLILFDEAFSSLDLDLRDRLCVQMRELIKKLQIGAIFVTHDQKEALILSDKIAIMHGGKIEQCADPKTIYETPKNYYIANFFGKINHIKDLGLYFRYEDAFFSQNSSKIKAKIQDTQYNLTHKIVKIALQDYDDVIFCIHGLGDDAQKNDHGFLHIKKTLSFN